MRSFALIITYVLCLQCIVFAQDIQTLQLQLKKAISTRDKIYTLDALANFYTWTEKGYDKAKLYGNQMISIAEERGDKELLALANVLNGIRLVQAIPSADREKELQKYFEEAIRIAKENRLPFYEAAAYIGLSGLQFHTVTADGDSMLRWGNEAMRLATVCIQRFFAHHGRRGRCDWP